ncbi:KdsC family phosphatase [Vulcaniibacterium gelatinicum]|uniref:KdsC family phosphatase n=1 Tax=Vulcaniibacterium gelatinicum TaxID=2598725 RepID=UPI0011C72D63|nr:HAD family hydrolase [Vulcaniibacterium gelatinicum]
MSVEHDPALLARAARIRLLGLDVDGTLTDGRLYFDGEGRELKAFHVHDGQGLVLLRRAGVHVALVTARRSPMVERRAAELGIEAHMGVADKRACMETLRERLALAPEQVAFMGDDLPDLTALRHAGLAVAPADAHPWIAARVHWRTQARGGAGAVRELCDLLLLAQGRVEAILGESAAHAVPADAGGGTR